VLAKIRETVEHVQKEILASVPLLPDTVAEMLIPLVRSVAEKGVKIRIMTMQGRASETMSKLTTYCEIRSREQMFGGGIIADGKEVILLLGQEEEVVNLAIWSDHVGLAGLAKSYFEFLWEDSASANEKAKKN